MSLRRRAVAVVVVAAVVAVLAALGWRLRPVKRYAVDAVVLDRDEAILFTSHLARRSRSFVHLMTTEGTTRWITEVSPFAVEPRGGLGAAVVQLAADREQVYVLVRNADWAGTVPRHEVAVIALHRRTGAQRWRRILATGRSLYGRSLLLVNGVLVVRHGTHDGPPDESETLTALEPRDGRVLWPTGESARLGFMISAQLTPTPLGSLLLAQRSSSSLRDGALVIDPRSGLATGSVPLRKVACVLPEGVLGFASGRRGDPTFVPRTGDAFGPARRLGPADTFAGPDLANEPVICGLHDRHAVLQLRQDCTGCGSSPLLASFDLATGALRWRVDFRDDFYLLGSTLGTGSLPRTLPVLVARAVGGGVSVTRDVAFVDVARGEILRRTPLSDSILLSVIASPTATSLQYLANGRSIWQRFDPSSGAPLRVLECPRGRLVGLETAAMFDRLWCLGRGEHGPRDLPFMTLEPSSGRVLHRHGAFAAATP